MQKKGLGRPPKFAGPTRVVTVTLPQATLRDLASLDEDRARAIVRATELAVGARRSAPKPEPEVDTFAVAVDSALITVPFCRPLTEIEGLRLIRILPTRHLVILDPGTPLAEVEIAITDKIDALQAGAEADTDRQVLVTLLERLRGYRRSHRSRTAEVILVATAGGEPG